MTPDLEQLRQLSDLRYRQSELRLAHIQAREASLRSELLRLQSLARQTHEQPDTDAELRSIGGDIIWLKWLSNSQRQLNIER